MQALSIPLNEIFSFDMFMVVFTFLFMDLFTTGGHCLNLMKKEVDKIESRHFSTTAKEALYSFLAYEYCILLSAVNKQPNSSTKRYELNKYKCLLKYTINPKVKKASMVNRFLGIRITELVLRFYNNRVRK